MGQAAALEVALSWGDTVVREGVFEPRARSVRIGAGDGVDFAVPVARDLSVATWTGGRWWIVPPPQACAERDGLLPTAAPFELAPGERATIAIAPELELRLHLRPVQPRAFTPVVRCQRELAVTLLASLAVHACLVACTWLTPASVSAIALDRGAPRVLAELGLYVAADPLEPLPRPGPNPSAVPRHHAPAGLAGDRRAIRPRGGGRAVPRRLPSFIHVRGAGILGVLAAMSGQFRDGPSPYDVALASAFEGGGPLDADLRASRGDGALGLSGSGSGACAPGDSCDAMLVPVGDGGGGMGEGTTCTYAAFEAIARARGVAKAEATCSVGAFGHGSGTGSGVADRSPELGFGRRHDGPLPTLRTIAPTATGSLTKQQVQRVFARGRAALASCYARSAEARPDLAGRLELVLVIAPSGAVQSAMRGATELGAVPELDSCMLDAARQWIFPAATGITIASHAVVLSPAGE